MKRLILIFMLLLSTLFAELKEDNFKTTANNTWGIYASHDEFLDPTTDYYLANWEIKDRGEKFWQSVQIFRDGVGYYDTFMILQLDDNMVGLDSNFMTIKFKIDGKTYEDEVTIIKKIGSRLFVNFTGDIYEILIDKMCLGLPLKISVKTLGGGFALLYTDNKNFKTKYEAVHNEYIKNHKEEEQL